MSSERPLGAFSISMSVAKPYLYWSTSIERTCSIVSCTAGICLSHLSRFQGPRVDETGRRARPFRPRSPSAYIGSRPAFRTPPRSGRHPLASISTRNSRGGRLRPARARPPSPRAHATAGPCRTNRPSRTTRRRPQGRRRSAPFRPGRRVSRRPRCSAAARRAAPKINGFRRRRAGARTRRRPASASSSGPVRPQDPRQASSAATRTRRSRRRSRCRRETRAPARRRG